MKSRAPKVALSNMMRCGACGSNFHKHHYSGKNRWSCALHKENKDLCRMPVLYEEEAYSAFLSIHNKLLDNIDILKTMLFQLIELQAKAIRIKPDIKSLDEKFPVSLNRIIHSQGYRLRGISILLFLLKKSTAIIKTLKSCGENYSCFKNLTKSAALSRELVCCLTYWKVQSLCWSLKLLFSRAW